MSLYYFRIHGYQAVLYTQVVGFVGGSDPDTGLSNIYNRVTWPVGGPLHPAVAQGFLQVLDLKNSPQGWPSLLVLGLSGYKVVNAVMVNVRGSRVMMALHGTKDIREEGKRIVSDPCERAQVTLHLISCRRLAPIGPVDV